MTSGSVVALANVFYGLTKKGAVGVGNGQACMIDVMLNNGFYHAWQEHKQSRRMYWNFLVRWGRWFQLSLKSKNGESYGVLRLDPSAQVTRLIILTACKLKEMIGRGIVLSIIGELFYIPSEGLMGLLLNVCLKCLVCEDSTLDVLFYPYTVNRIVVGHEINIGEVMGHLQQIAAE